MTAKMTKRESTWPGGMHVFLSPCISPSTQYKDIVLLRWLCAWPFIKWEFKLQKSWIWFWFDKSQVLSKFPRRKRTCSPSAEVLMCPRVDQKNRQLRALSGILPRWLETAFSPVIFGCGFCSALHGLHERKILKWSTGLMILPSKQNKKRKEKYILQYPFWSILSSKVHLHATVLRMIVCVSVSNIKDNARSFHSVVNTSTQCTQKGFTTTSYTTISLKKIPHVKFHAMQIKL